MKAVCVYALVTGLIAVDAANAAIMNLSVMQSGFTGDGVDPINDASFNNMSLPPTSLSAMSGGVATATHIVNSFSQSGDNLTLNIVVTSEVTSAMAGVTSSFSFSFDTQTPLSYSATAEIDGTDGGENPTVAFTTGIPSLDINLTGDGTTTRAGTLPAGVFHSLTIDTGSVEQGGEPIEISFSLTLSPVPEPAGLSLVGMFALALATVRRRSRS